MSLLKDVFIVHSATYFPNDIRRPLRETTSSNIDYVTTTLESAKKAADSLAQISIDKFKHLDCRIESVRSFDHKPNENLPFSTVPYEICLSYQKEGLDMVRIYEEIIYVSYISNGCDNPL